MAGDIEVWERGSRPCVTPGCENVEPPWEEYPFFCMRLTTFAYHCDECCRRKLDELASRTA